MTSNRIALLPALFILLTVLWFPVQAQALPGTAVPLFYFKCQPVVKQTDGRFIRTLILEGPSQAVLSAKVFYTHSGTKTVFKAVADQGRVDLVSGQRAFFNIFAVANASGRLMHRHPVPHSTCGAIQRNRSQGTPAVPEEVAMLKGVPLPFVGAKMFQTRFWPQTGESFDFFVHKGLDDTVPLARTAPLKVRQREQVRALTRGANTKDQKTMDSDTKGPDTKGPDSKSSGTTWVHVPDHDRELNRTGAVAFREDIVFSDTPMNTEHNGICISAAYTFMVHRSRFAQNSAVYGWSILAGATAFFSGWVVIKRRQPWWRG